MRPAADAVNEGRGGIARRFRRFFRSPGRSSARGPDTRPASPRAVVTPGGGGASRRSGSRATQASRHQRASSSWMARNARDCAEALGVDERRQRLPGRCASRRPRRRRRCSGGRARPRASVPTASGDPTARGGTRAAGCSGTRRRVGEAARAPAARIAPTALLPVAVRSKPMPVGVGAVVVDRRPVGARAARRPTGPGRSGGRAPSGGAGRAASCSPPPPRATPASSSTPARRTRRRCVNVMRSHSSAMSRGDERMDPRPAARTRTSSPDRRREPHQLRSVPMLATPAMPVACVAVQRSRRRRFATVEPWPLRVGVRAQHFLEERRRGRRGASRSRGTPW